MVRVILGAALTLLATLCGVRAAETGAPTPAPTAAEIEQAASDTDPTSTVKAWTFVNTYSGATYGPKSLRILQIVPREEIVKVASTLLRINLPSMNVIDGVDSGFGDMQTFYQVVNRYSPTSATGIGLSAWIPTASDPNFGTGRWSIGPSTSYVNVNRRGGYFDGFLMQSFFSFAGPAARGTQSLVTFQPGFVKLLGSGWSLRSADATWQFDLAHGATVMPLSLGFGKLIHMKTQAINLVLADSVTVVHANAPAAPKNTLRFLVRIVYPRNYPAANR